MSEDTKKSIVSGIWSALSFSENISHLLSFLRQNLFFMELHRDEILKEKEKEANEAMFIKNVEEKKKIMLFVILKEEFIEELELKIKEQNALLYYLESWQSLHNKSMSEFALKNLTRLKEFKQMSSKMK